MIKAYKLVVSIFLIIGLTSCNDDNSSDENESTAKAIYNQAYQENFAEDKIPNILDNARNAFVLLDPFMDDVVSSINAIKANGNEVCGYISIGTGEDWRSDYSQLQPYLVSIVWGQWAGEYFVNSTTTGIVDIMKARIDQLALWGCDWVEFDNMDWFYDDDLRVQYGYQVTEAEGVAYFNTLCDYAHEKGLKCLAKNMTNDALNFDGVLYESYNNEKNWWNSAGAQEFLDAGKLVIVNHYNEVNCNAVYSEYKGVYNANLSYICEDVNLEKYVHYNE
ncbi:MAG: endo alpha-1,4 polygalactosaminidase [Flavobacteriaceae bacterium]